ncbi:MAG: histidine phosphatase family protein [Acidobacteria bacterium]|nr:histidine phosphatase family protein [Acidobacteriota bacterium]
MVRPKLYLVTHGETALDLEGRMHGQTVDAPLTLKGWMTAQKAAKQLKDKSITKIYSSPLKRARETAQVIAQQLGVPVEVRDELLPMDIGRMAGAKSSSIEPLLNYFSARPEKPIPDGESKSAFLGRWKGFYQKLRGQKRTVAVVAHSQHALALEYVRKGTDPRKVKLWGAKAGEVHAIPIW